MDRMMNFRASDELFDLVQEASVQAGVDRSRWLRIVVEAAANRELATHRFSPIPIQERGLVR